MFCPSFTQINCSQEPFETQTPKLLLLSCIFFKHLYTAHGFGLICVSRSINELSNKEKRKKEWDGEKEERTEGRRQGRRKGKE